MLTFIVHHNLAMTGSLIYPPINTTLGLQATQLYHLLETPMITTEPFKQLSAVLFPFAR